MHVISAKHVFLAMDLLKLVSKGASGQGQMEDPRENDNNLWGSTEGMKFIAHISDSQIFKRSIIHVTILVSYRISKAK
jgi:hypothetical protein